MRWWKELKEDVKRDQLPVGYNDVLYACIQNRNFREFQAQKQSYRYPRWQTVEINDTIEYREQETKDLMANKIDGYGRTYIVLLFIPYLFIYTWKESLCCHLLYANEY